MKAYVKHLLLSAVLLTLVCCLCITAYATENPPTDYDSLFARSNEVDGYLADAYAFELADIYEQNPAQFIAELSTQEVTKIETVAFLLSIEYQFRNSSQLENELIEISSFANTEELYVISSILSQLDNYCSPHHNNNRNNEYLFPDRTFNVEVVKSVIVKRLAVNRNISGEFCGYISEMYQLNPTLFAEMIDDLPTEDINLLADCIASDMSLQNTTPPVITNGSSTLNILQSEILSSLQTQNLLTETQVIPTAEPEADLLSSTTIKPTSVQFTYTYDRDYAYVGDSVDINITFTTNKTISSLIIFRVKLYQHINGRYQEIFATNVAATPGSYNGSFTYTDSFAEPGVKSFLVRIYESSGTTSLYTTGSNALSIIGRWSISVDLPEYRWDLGYMTLYNPCGVATESDICLGGALLNDGINEPSQKYGNTPTGVYTGYLDGPFSPSESYGIYKVIRLTGVSGEIMECTNRSGLLIHGGRDGQSTPGQPYYPLYPTNGCIRVTSNFQSILENTITDWLSTYDYLDNSGDITVTQYETVSIPDI